MHNFRQHTNTNKGSAAAAGYWALDEENFAGIIPWFCYLFMPRCTHARGRLKNSIFIFIIAFLIGAFLLSHSLLLLALTHEEVVGKNGKTASLHATRKEGRKKKFLFLCLQMTPVPLTLPCSSLVILTTFSSMQWCVTLYKIIENSIFQPLETSWDV